MKQTTIESAVVLKRPIRKINESALKVSKHNQPLPVISWELDVEAKIIRFYNSSNGWAQEEISIEKGKSYCRSNYQRLLDEALQACIECLVPIDLELAVSLGPGEDKWFHIVGHPVREGGKVILVKGTCRDIGREKMMQLSDNVSMLNLEARLKKQALALETAEVGIWEWDLVFKTLDLDRQMFKLYGVEPCEVDFEWLKKRIHPEDVDRTENEIANALQGKKKFETKFRIIWPNGELRLIRSRGEVYCDSDGEAVQMIGMNWDITEEELKTEKLKQSLKDAKDAQYIGDFGYFDYCMLSDTVELSDKVHEIFGLGESGFVDGLGHFMSMVHPDDRQKVHENMQNAILNNVPHDIQHRIIRTNGEERIVHERARVYYDTDGRPIKIIGTCQDVTEKSMLINSLEENLEFEAKLTEIALEFNKPTPLKNKISRILNVLGNALDANQILIFQRNREEMSCHLKFHWSEGDKFWEPVSKILTCAELPSLRQIGSQKDPLVYDETNRAPQDLAPVFRSWGSEAMVICPIFIDEAFFGFVCVSQFEPRKWRSTEIRHMVMATAIIATGLKENMVQEYLSESELKYKYLYDHTPAMMHSIDEEGNLLSVSDYWLETMGYEQGEVLGRKVLEFMTKESRKNSLQLTLPQFFKSKAVRNVPLQFVKKSGEIIDVLLSAIPELDHEGNFVRSLTVITDVTAEKKAEQEIKNLNANLEDKVKHRTSELEQISKELAEQKNLLEGIVENTSSVIYVKDTQGKFILVNNQFLKVFGKERHEVIGRNDRQVFRKDLASYMKRTDQIVIKDGKLIQYEEVLNSDDHAEVYLTFKFPLYNQRREVSLVCGISTNITIQKNQEDKVRLQAEELRVSNQILSHQQEQLKRNQQRLMEANEELKSFSYSVSHDLRAPLRALEGFSNLLLQHHRDTLDAKGRTWLNYINTNAMKMDVLIKDILAFSKISTSDISKTSINMDQLVREIIGEEVTNYINHKLLINIPTLQDCYGDPGTIRQVWVNLISNAFKYSSSKETIDISITSSETEDYNEYQIRDKGTGFNPDYASKLFRVFQRLHKEQEFNGTGVGLAIVKKIIDKHGGEIFAEGSIGNGASFTFRLPKSNEKFEKD